MKKKSIATIIFIAGLYSISFSQINEVDLPVKNFEKLWNEFNDRYANFELKAVDWNEVYKKYRSRVNEKTTNKELFELCCSMLQELKDGHVTLNPNFEESDIECGPPYRFTLDVEFDTEEKVKQLGLLIDSELTKNGFSKAVRKRLSSDTNFTYRVSDSLAYLRLDEMTEKITFGKFRKEVDKALEAFKPKKGLIIDLRFNGGGWDYNSYKLASRFIPKGKTIGHFERKRIKGTDKYSAMKYRSVKAEGKNQFVKPIVILTSDFTASAAEVFLLIMRELPHVSIIGDHTEGIFSDMYEFSLPNKWEVSLSHQQYFSNNKENFEGKGIPPDIYVINKSSDLENQSDPVLQKAIRFLNNPANVP